MKSIAISGALRAHVGKKYAKNLRYQGQVPAVLYGGQEHIHLSVSALDLKPLVYTPDASFIDLHIGQLNIPAIIQDIQFHPLTDQILHVDFLELNENRPVTMRIPIQLTGSAPGVRMGGKLVQRLRKLRIEALPKDHVPTIEVNIEKLGLGQSVRVGDLKEDKLVICDMAEEIIVSVQKSRVARQAEQEATGE